MNQARMVLTLGIIFVVFGSGLVLAQDNFDADTREVSAYVLTETGLTQFSQAAANLGQLGSSLPGDCEEDQIEEDNSLDGMVTRIEAVPAARLAIVSAGISAREYVVFLLAMAQAGFAAWALDQPGGTLTPGISMANVEFYRAHETEIQAAASQIPSDECDGNEDDS